MIERKKRKTRKTSKPDQFRIEGYILLMVSDTIFPNVFMFINNYFDKKNKIKASDMMLTEHQEKKLEPLADQAADFIAIHINPVAGFALVSCFMYTNNFMMLKNK